MNKQTNDSKKLKNVQEVIQQIINKSTDGDYIYRGENENYRKVSSSLYNVYDAIDAKNFDIKEVQKEILKNAKNFTHETDDFEILTTLQHHGGKTNLIDFTTDYLIALFFACDGGYGNDGRVILLKKELIKDQIKEPKNPRNRVIAQKSVFVQPPEGCIEPNTVVSVPEKLKQPILNYLRKYHGISTETIYNDLHGFIRTQAIHKSIYTEFYRGMSYSKNGDYDKAIDCYTEAINLKHDLTPAYNNRGNAYAYKGKYEQAIADFDEVIALNPDLAEAYYNRGITYADKGDYERAIIDYDRAIELTPDYAAAYHNRGNAYYKKNGKGDYDRAIADHDRAIKLNPDYAKAYVNRGNAYAGKGESDRAIADYDKAIELKPDYAEAYNNRGIAYYKRNGKGEYDKAIADYDKAIELEPNLAVAYCNRGNTYSDKGDYEQAIADFDKAIKLKRDYADAYSGRGVVYIYKGDFERAIENFDKAIELNPDLADAYHGRGFLHRIEGRYKRAIADYDKAIELKPNLAKAYSNRGEACLHLQRWEQARSDLQTAQDRGVGIIDFFNVAYKNVAGFESKTGIKLPADIAEMLTREPDKGKS